MTDLFAPLRTLDWGDVAAVGEVGLPLLEAVATGDGVLGALVRDATGDRRLLDLGEHLPWADKVVLHDDPTGFRLRLHIFQPGYRDRPHSHRWAFASRILHGGYRHEVWGSEADIDPTAPDPSALRLLTVRHEATGSSYALGDSTLHCFTADPGTVSLVLRGPATKDRNMGVDPATGQVRWKYGAADEPAAARRQVELTPEHLGRALDALAGHGLI